MIYSELILASTLSDQFHIFSEQLTGINPASRLQLNKRPKSRFEYPLAYFKIFHNPNSNPLETKDFLGLLSFGFLCAAPELDMMEIMGYPHGLKCLQAPIDRRGIVGVIMVGDGVQWKHIMQIKENNVIQEWISSCHLQFKKHDLNIICD